MNIDKLYKLSLACICTSAAFSLSMISFHGDISLVAFPLSLAFTVMIFFAALKKLFQQKNLAFIAVYRELLQYLPYVLLIAFVFRRAGNSGTSLVLDFISVLFWLLSSAISIVILHFLNPKKIGAVSSEWKKFSDEQKLLSSKKTGGAKKAVKEIVSWIDALVQAVFMVLLLNVFIVQLYEIPSESMVPEFLIKDRVVVFKTFSGPKFPLSQIGLPYAKKYNRGDIVVFRNPHYSNDRKSEVRTFLSQLVYMCTLTKVNLNVEADGNPKADPLVKRVCGVEGEQLMMQDGILYSRTSSSPEFMPVEADSKWAAWNLNSVRPSLKKGIQMIPLTEKDYEAMISIEEQRRNLNVEKIKNQCITLAESFKNLSKNAKKTSGSSFSLSEKEMNEYNLFVNNESITMALLEAQNGSVWFDSFMTDWISKSPDFNGDLYSEANWRLNLMIKLCLGNMIVNNAKMLNSGRAVSELRSSPEKIEYLRNAEALNSYVYLLDRRNMPVFPANDKDGNPVYIPSGCYFMMGDNRFNSLDMRHSYDSWITKISSYDEYSVTYFTDMAPQYINRSRMLGTTSYRFWPLNRAGKPGLTGK